MHPAQVRHLVDRAVRIARVRRAVTCLIFPKDVQEMAAIEEAPHESGTIHRVPSRPIGPVGLYWHFVDIVWLFVLPALYLLGRAP